MRRRDLVSLLGATAAGVPLLAHAQTAGAMRRVGILGSSLLRPIQSFKAKLAALGYVVGGNLALAERYAEGRDDRFPALAAELVSLPADVIVAWGTPAALAAKRANTSIPTVVVSGDVVNTGIVSNLARPEANITGFIAINVQLEEKRIELLKELVPDLKRVAVLANSLNPLNQSISRQRTAWPAILRSRSMSSRCGALPKSTAPCRISSGRVRARRSSRPTSSC